MFTYTKWEAVYLATECVSTSINLRSSPKVKKSELLLAFSNHRGAQPVRKEMSFVDSQDGEQGVTFKQDGRAAK
jgi:hypothetical protein